MRYTGTILSSERLESANISPEIFTRTGYEAKFGKVVVGKANELPIPEITEINEIGNKIAAGNSKGVNKKARKAKTISEPPPPSTQQHNEQKQQQSPGQTPGQTPNRPGGQPLSAHPAHRVTVQFP